MPFLGHSWPFLATSTVILRRFVRCLGESSANLSKMMQGKAKLCKNKPFFSGDKTLVLLLKKRSKLTFQPMKMCSSGCVWKHPELLLVVFMQFYEGLDDF